MEEKTGLAVLGCILPELDGFEVCRMLKQDSRARNIPVIMPADGDEAETDAFITKPFVWESLREKIRETLDR